MEETQNMSKDDKLHKRFYSSSHPSLIVVILIHNQGLKFPCPTLIVLSYHSFISKRGLLIVESTSGGVYELDMQTQFTLQATQCECKNIWHFLNDLQC
jgi:hypothetical protein